jgi:hypothetical protein
MSHCTALILYENSFKSSEGRAEDSDNPLWTANWYKDICVLLPFECQHHSIQFQSKYDNVIFSFSPALNMSFNFLQYSTHAHTHTHNYTANFRHNFFFALCSVTLFYSTHYEKELKCTAFNGLYFSEVLTTCTPWQHNPQLSICFTYQNWWDEDHVNQLTLASNASTVLHWGAW